MRKFLILMCLVGYTLGVCPVPDFDTIPKLNLANQIGTWQAHGILRGSQKPIGNIECLNIGISSDNLVDQPVTLKSHVMWTDLDDNNKMVMINVQAQIENLQRPGRWIVDYKSGSEIFTASLIYTDYVEYSLISLCNDKELYVLFLSRSYDIMPNSTRENLLKKLKDVYGIDTQNYKSIRQSSNDCMSH